MNENNIFIVAEQTARPPGHGNNCHGHNRSIQAGGNGHWVGDSCGCDGGVNSPTAPIDTALWILFIVAFLLIGWYAVKVNKKRG